MQEGGDAREEYGSFDQEVEVKRCMCGVTGMVFEERGVGAGA